MSATRSLDPRQHDITSLFADYLTVVNAALRAGQHKPRYARILAAGEEGGAAPFGVEVYADGLERPRGRLAARLGRRGFEVVPGLELSDQHLAWKVQLEHVRNVVAHREDYVGDPHKLDFDWLRTRLDA